jgi:hypothetical protein
MGVTVSRSPMRSTMRSGSIGGLATASTIFASGRKLAAVQPCASAATLRPATTASAESRARLLTRSVVVRSISASGRASDGQVAMRPAATCEVSAPRLMPLKATCFEPLPRAQAAIMPNSFAACPRWCNPELGGATMKLSPP